VKPAGPSSSRRIRQYLLRTGCLSLSALSCPLPPCVWRASRLSDPPGGVIPIPGPISRCCARIHCFGPFRGSKTGLAAGGWRYLWCSGQLPPAWSGLSCSIVGSNSLVRTWPVGSSTVHRPARWTAVPKRPPYLAAIDGRRGVTSDLCRLPCDTQPRSQKGRAPDTIRLVEVAEQSIGVALAAEAATDRP
jgi:hypothetical protein